MARTSTTRGHRAVRFDGAPSVIASDGSAVAREIRFTDAGDVSHDLWRELSSHMERIRERERTRLSRELHDVMAQALTGLKLDLALHRKVCGGADADLNRCTSTVNDLMREVQRIAYELRPQVLDDAGLVPALEYEIDEFSRRISAPCRLRIEGTPLTIEAEVSTALFRICQELLTNVVRHSHATRAWITLSFGDQHVCLDVRDNGDGLREVPSEYRKRLGLIGMQERAAAVGGHIVLYSAPGHGTRVHATVPLCANSQLNQANGCRHL